jgi:hypothetical protein
MQVKTKIPKLAQEFISNNLDLLADYARFQDPTDREIILFSLTNLLNQTFQSGVAIGAELNNEWLTQAS